MTPNIGSVSDNAIMILLNMLTKSDNLSLLRKYPHPNRVQYVNRQISIPPNINSTEMFGTLLISSLIFRSIRVDYIRDAMQSRTYLLYSIQSSRSTHKPSSCK